MYKIVTTANSSKQAHQSLVRFLRIISGPCARVTALLLIVALNWVGLLGVGSTIAYFTDIEAATQNSFVAGELDITLVNDTLTSHIGVEALGEVDYASLVALSPLSVPTKYITRASNIAGDADFCAAIDIEATRNGLVQYAGPLEGLALLPTQDFGAWEFEFDVPPLVPVGHGDVCNFDIAFDAFLLSAATTTESGFSDTERVSFDLTAKMVVLNEILPNPSSSATYPNNSEWIELYNNGDTPVDIAGWVVSELSGGVTENLYTIVASSPASNQIGTLAGSTIIPAHGYAVLLFADPTKLNNTGDTVTLYDNNNVLLDKRSFGSIAVGKTVARSPNGIGVWFDPIPTPGESNIIVPGDEELPPEVMEVSTEALLVTEDTLTVEHTDSGVVDTPHELLIEQEAGSEIVEETTPLPLLPEPTPFDDNDTAHTTYNEVTDAVAETREEDIMPARGNEVVANEATTTDVVESVTVSSSSGGDTETHEEVVIVAPVTEVEAIKEDYEAL